MQNKFYTLEELPYGYSDLEPFISKEQLTLHYEKHHASYVNNANKILGENEIKDPKKLSFNIGGHKLHSLFWENMISCLLYTSKAFSNVEIIAFVDRDDNLEEMKQGKTVIRKLVRKEFENYLFDKVLLRKYCETNGKNFNETEFDNLVKDIVNDEVKDKGGDIIKKCCNCNLSTDFKDVYKRQV